MRIILLLPLLALASCSTMHDPDWANWREEPTKYPDTPTNGAWEKGNW